MTLEEIIQAAGKTNVEIIRESRLGRLVSIYKGPAIEYYGILDIYVKSVTAKKNTIIIIIKPPTVSVIVRSRKTGVLLEAQGESIEEAKTKLEELKKAEEENSYGNG